MSKDKLPWVVGVDLGATKIAAGLVSPQNKIVKKVYMSTGAVEGPAAVVERIAACATQLETELPAGNRKDRHTPCRTS